MDDKGQNLPSAEAVSVPNQAITAAATEAGAAFASLDTVVAAGEVALERVERRLHRMTALLAGSDTEPVGGTGSLAAMLESATIAADHLLERLTGLTTVTERATDPEPWRALRGEVEAAVEGLDRISGIVAGMEGSAGTAASGQLALFAGRDGGAGQRSSIPEASQTEANGVDTPRTPLPSDTPYTRMSHSAMETQGGSTFPIAYSKPAISVTVQTPPLGAEYWHGLFRTPGFEEALRQFLSEWAYQQAQQANPGPGY